MLMLSQFFALAVVVKLDSMPEPRRPQEVAMAAEQIEPRLVLTPQNLMAGAQVGLGLVLELHPLTGGAKRVGKVLDVAKVTIEEMPDAVDFRTRAVESRLLLVGEEAERLEAIRERDGHLQSDEAGVILGGLREGHFTIGDEYSFLAKSVASKRLVYRVASHYYTDKWMKKISRRVALSWPAPGNRVHKMWAGKNSYVRRYSSMSWNSLQQLAQASQRFTNAVQVYLAKQIGKRLAKNYVRAALDREVDAIMEENPSISSAATVLRVNMATEPFRAIPIAQVALAPQPLSPAVQAMQPVMIAPIAPIAVHRDPVVSAASVNGQVLSAYRAPLDDNNPAPVEHPSRASSSEPIRSSSSAPRMPNIGGSFTGASGSSLTTRH
ncbi:MAG: hypothetical protein ACR2G6_17705 [Gemmatimonadaceae bacterium]